jgi:hypothetical protein
MYHFFTDNYMCVGKQVAGVPHLRLSSHPTWHAQVSAWDLWLDLPDSTMVDRWQANIVLREDILTIAGLPPGKGGNQAPVACTLSELSPFLLYQVFIFLHSSIFQYEFELYCRRL